MSQDEATEMFKKINLAHDILSDPKKRRAYDSQEAFDDSIPRAEDFTSDEDFFSLFSEVFERNAKWSRDIKSPTLGDMATPIDDVDYFFSYWYEFKSWRDFSYLDEYDLEEAESREEKRWMEKKMPNRDKRKNVKNKPEYSP